MKRIPEFRPNDFKTIIEFDGSESKKIFSDFFIEPLSVWDERVKMPSLPHRKTVNDFVFIEKGEVLKMVCSDVFTLRAGDFMLLPEYKVRALMSKSENIQGYYCHFSDDFISEGSGLKKIQEIFRLTELTNTHIFQLDKEHQQRLELLLKQLLCLYEANNKESLLKLYLFTIIGELVDFMKSLPTPVFSPKESITQRFRRLIAKNIQNTHTVQTYAEQLHISPNHLNKCIRDTTGKTASDLINETLLVEAKVLLSLQHYTIGEAAFSLGFEDVSYFSRFFKKHSGQRPSDYRKKIDLS